MTGYEFVIVLFLGWSIGVVTLAYSFKTRYDELRDRAAKERDRRIAAEDNALAEEREQVKVTGDWGDPVWGVHYEE